MKPCLPLPPGRAAVWRGRVLGGPARPAAAGHRGRAGGGGAVEPRPARHPPPHTLLLQTAAVKLCK